MQQAAQAEAQRRAQPVNMEMLCKAVADGHCARCFPGGTERDIVASEMARVDIDADAIVIDGRSTVAYCASRRRT
jgi:hypothetical protein